VAGGYTDNKQSRGFCDLPVAVHYPLAGGPRRTAFGRGVLGKHNELGTTDVCNRNHEPWRAVCAKLIASCAAACKGLGLTR
jgi:hypothetical protein